jgi:hypothetical protein
VQAQFKLSSPIPFSSISSLSLSLLFSISFISFQAFLKSELNLLSFSLFFLLKKLKTKVYHRQQTLVSSHSGGLLLNLFLLVFGYLGLFLDLDF